MKLIIAGGRDINAFPLLHGIFSFLNLHGEVTEVVSGGATGVDSAGEGYALANNIPVKKFPADWNQHGRAAGPIRNRQMADYADALLLIWDGTSRGSANMKQEMGFRGKIVFEVVVKV